MRDLFLLVSAAALLACGSPSSGGSESGGSGAGASAAGAAGNSAVGGNASAGAAAGGVSASGASAGGASSGGVGGTLANGGTSNGGVAGAAVSAGAGGSSGSAQGGSGGVAGALASAGNAGSADDTVDSCLPVGQEKLVMKITGTPALDITTPSGLKCLSQYLPPDETNKTQFNLVWDTADGTLNIAVRGDDLAPLKTGTFDPFAVLIANEDKAWLGLPNKCHVTVTASEKIGEEHPPGFTREVYKVTGSVACDSGWALGKPTDTLDQFQFVTRVTRAVSP